MSQLEKAKKILSEIESKEKEVESLKTELVKQETLFGSIKEKLKKEFGINDSKELTARITELEKEIDATITEYEGIANES